MQLICSNLFIKHLIDFYIHCFKKREKEGLITILLNRKMRDMASFPQQLEITVYRIFCVYVEWHNVI